MSYKSRGTGVRYDDVDEAPKPAKPKGNGRLTSSQEWMLILLLFGLALMVKAIAAFRALP